MTIHVYCYKVLHPGLPDGGLWTYEDFPAAFEHATGVSWDAVKHDDIQIDALLDTCGAEITCFGWSV